MTLEHRYVGVARPPQGLDPDAPRVVHDLSRPRAPTGAPALPTSPPSTFVVPSFIVPSSVMPTSASPTPAATLSRRAGSPRPNRHTRMYGYRRRWRRVIYRRFEIAAWLGAVAVVIAVAAVVVQQVPPAGARVEAGTRVGTEASPLYEGAACVFDPCPRPAPSGPPTRLRIRSIDVETPLQVLALDADRKLEPPKSYEQAGWYAKGVVPGDAGAAVVAGHVDSRNGPAVFYHLHTLRSGDVVEIQRGGDWLTFRVTTVERYRKDQFPTDRVYRPTPGPELRLITCGGDFDRSLLSYRDNIVVYAIMV